ncbi:MAG: selenide, water dikinase SelD [Ignavibacteria bacterium]|nr:selenide, water dikinase SelD [Ignavibacteria bacterium]
MDNKKIRLTQMVTSAGCAAKIFPYILSDALKSIKWVTNENVLVGFSGKDDAGVYKLGHNLALIHTTDFFTPVVDDPFTFGQIAAANAMSDVYAMGGVPLSALNIVAFPQKEDINILKEILRGGMEKASEDDCVIIGGHSIDIPTIVYGLSVTGTVNPAHVKGNDKAKAGDALILTKALGTGLLNNSIKYDKLDDGVYTELVKSMTRLNKCASEAMIRAEATACTDVTGFGLAGHAMQMAQASNVIIKIKTNELPILNGAELAIKENLLTRGDKSNREYTKDFVINEGQIDKTKEHIVYDPQTSGGLLISVPENKSQSLLKDLHTCGDDNSRIIGEVVSPTKETKPGTIIFDFR